MFDIREPNTEIVGERGQVALQDVEMSQGGTTSDDGRDRLVRDPLTTGDAKKLELCESAEGEWERGKAVFGQIEMFEIRES
eukprot:CAMPEP_0197391142 /NCGR_PEP_ID=MMETSP1165-20131217/2898_1 /TAXON_ID=284809 /ORGANISM="Chrysocystis fragilis, Strain CCMP3189" /LENGTH=80 /DNA_ID=CAMNT_0042916695 /DNA_START=56 /DNA_END=295 /DNA_ORIENTATION=+